MFRMHICKHISLVAAAHCCLPRSWQVLHELLLLLLQRQEPQLRAPLVLSIYKFSRYFSRPLFSSPFLTLLALIKLCVCECVYYYYYAQLCTRLQLLIIIMNPCPPSPLLTLSRSLAIDAFLFIAAINKFSQCGNATNKSKTTTTTTTTVKSAMNNEQCRLGE